MENSEPGSTPCFTPYCANMEPEHDFVHIDEAADEISGGKGHHAAIEMWINASDAMKASIRAT